ncbi:HMP/thiamine ABC transporter substrate-binding protein ThiU [Bacillus subtilis]|uniref:HMP/thiamine ABC transporter substrate-binding protein ThiU n=1 Tax=Bacillus subtilis TaxID=1423 RepID=UPI00240E8CB5|nr:HMP/thiamine ABC transporter substrate-binding protein ThiU [Bacillus subtilis]MEC3650949.1 HMP/thiamine ABC transporter substrate-binding protein ThiU [Bacillus subtilis]WEY89928.1 HMP/thiamine ABC transporter substrate-binding protein ThiU [Bacillus subtilis]WEZ21479.1 HMP/thiamine ABC transporter substrate-binding protein ThiU [Bacillus subtilis]
MEHICGTSRIAGFRFSLYPMTDDFISVIKSALKKTDTSKVWTKTDHISTVLRGSIDHVFDAAKAIYLHAANSEKHIVMNGTFSIGCPGDTQGDTYLSKGDKRVNEDAVRGLKAEAPCQFALYPMNEPDYMGLIMKAVDIAKAQGTFVQGVHYASELDGDAHDVFSTLESVFRMAEQQTNHITMTVNLSANSPSRKNRKQG